jgi:hypothetical protein
MLKAIPYICTLMDKILFYCVLFLNIGKISLIRKLELRGYFSRSIIALGFLQ